MDTVRITIVVMGGVAALGSTSSNPPPQYAPAQQPQPYAQQQAPQPYAQQPQVQPQYTACEYACGQVARCNMAPYPDCLQTCRAQGHEQRPEGQQQLYALARASCTELGQMQQQGQPPPPPAADLPPPPDPDAHAANDPPASSEKPAKQWTCNASGTWQKCDKNNAYSCFSQTTNAMGFGVTEALARGSAEAMCGNFMSRLMMANFASTTRVTFPCHASSCTPP